MCTKNLTHTHLLQVLAYNKNTGIFKWKKNFNGPARRGAVAGCTRPDGYVLIGIKGVHYHAHRLAWLYVYGYLPENNIDHINGNRSDNRIENLREVSQVCNLRNCGNHKNNTSGVKGVQWDKARDKWVVRVVVMGKQLNFGRHDDFDEAVCMRLAAEQCLDWSGCDSSSPAYKHVSRMIQNEY